MQELKEISEIKQDPSNPNKGNKKGRELIKQSIKKFGAGRSILVDKNNVCIAGNNVHRSAMEHGFIIRVIETTGNELVVVKRTDIDINTPEGRELSLADNVAAKQNITWDKDVLQKEFKEYELEKWGLTSFEKQIKSTPLRWMPSIGFKSGNKYDIPDSLLEGAATAAINYPFVPWGSQKRGSSAASLHFYVDDYRFQTIWDNPNPVFESGARTIVEPNLSTDNYMPFAYGLFLIFKKRWFSRLMQEAGNTVFVDVHVADKFRDLNFVGLPEGWKSFATRGYSEDPESLVKDIESAKGFAGNDLNMIVYGGGAQCEKIALDHGCTYLKPFTSKHKNNGEGKD